MARPLAPRTVREYERVLARGLNEYGQLRSDVERWPNSERALLRAALRARIAEKGVHTDAYVNALNVLPPVVWQRRTVVAIPTEEECLRYEAAARALPPARAALALIPLAIGTRSDELLNLSRLAVARAARGQLALVRKGNRAQTLDSAHCASLFAELLNARPASKSVPAKKTWDVVREILSPSTYITAYHAFRDLVAATGLAAGIPGMRPHKLRHAWATRMLRDGAPLATISWALGHSDIKTTMRYLHPAAADVRGYMRRFDQSPPKEDSREAPRGPLPDG